ncbi:MAG: class I SAM-dependent methyltransferase [Vicingaceae bacterium]
MKKTENNTNWFAEWFDSDFYHILYQHRDHSEAEAFINQVTRHLALPENATVMDLACGKGRHSIQLNELGFDVLGLDLSKESIQFAKQFENDNLHFTTGDMRQLDFSNQFDLVLNLFTSFGYFHEENDNLLVIESIAKVLKEGGKLVLDYLNTVKVSAKLPQSEEIVRKNTTFNTHKFVEGDFIVKDISFESEGKVQKFQEYVRRIDLQKFKTYFQRCGLELQETFGDYHLNDFDEKKSERLILIAQKTK